MVRKNFFLSALLIMAAAPLLSQPKFSKPHGLYKNRFSLKITKSDANAEIRFTTDGSEPTINSKLYSTSSTIVQSTTILRAAEFKNGERTSDINTVSYIFPTDVLKQSNTPTGYPSTWGKYTSMSGTAIADYEMDPDMTSDPQLAPKIVEGFYSLPILSIISDKNNFFNHTKDPNTGGIYIYTGTSESNGRGWERPASVELIGGNQNFDLTVNCAIKMHGGQGRVPEKNPKHSFRLVFKDEYGPNVLDYPIYGQENISEFNSLIVRTFYNYSWTHSDATQRKQAQYERDLWARRMQKRMGYSTSDGIYVHVFLNGLYWGLYNLTERIDETYCREHLGGKKSDYDIIKREDYLEAAEGSLDKWNQLVSLSEKASDNKIYLTLLGQLPVSDAVEPEVFLDVDNLIDYMLINQYGGNADWDHHNWIAVRNRERGNRGFQFICWDTEQTFQSASRNVLDINNKGCPTYIFLNLMKNRTFLHRYMDRAYKHLTHDGLLTEKKAVELWDSLYNSISLAVYDEAARWGDYRRDVHPYSSKGELYSVDGHYLPERQRLLTSFFPTRTATVISQLKSKGWFPKEDAPTFLVNGEAVLNDSLTREDVLTLSGTNRILYTTDLSDPVSWVTSSSGNPTPTAQLYDGGNLLDLLQDTKGWVTIRAINQSNAGWSATVDHSFYIKNETGIMAARQEPDQHASPIFDLQGHRLTGTPRHGIYIQNGKKYMKN